MSMETSRQGRAGLLLDTPLNNHAVKLLLHHQLEHRHAEHNRLEGDKEDRQSKSSLTLLAQGAKVGLLLHGHIVPAARPALDGVDGGGGVDGVEHGHGDDGDDEAHGRGAKIGSLVEDGVLSQL